MNSLQRRLLAVIIYCVANLPLHAQEQELTSKTLRLDASSENSPAIYAGSQLITQYVPESNTKPIFFPLQTVTGNRVIRNYPVAASPEFEKKDHPHHRSFWFTFGSINGIDYWSEEAEDKQGYVVSSGVKSKQDKESIVIDTEWEWYGPDREPQANSVQKFQFTLRDGVVHFETSIRLTASHGDLAFGDTKEGAFAVRVGELMKVDAKKGGRIINDRGFADDATWGKPARWVEYTGPVQQEANTVEDASKLPIAGVTMLVHPSSFGYPGRWHVRSYGLFAHNPFGVRDFLPSQGVLDEQEQARQNGFTLKAGDEIFLRYLVLLHDGKLEPQKIDAIWNEFANR